MVIPARSAPRACVYFQPGEIRLEDCLIVNLGIVDNVIDLPAVGLRKLFYGLRIQSHLPSLWAWCVIWWQLRHCRKAQAANSRPNCVYWRKGSGSDDPSHGSAS